MIFLQGLIVLILLAVIGFINYKNTIRKANHLMNLYLKGFYEYKNR